MPDTQMDYKTVLITGATNGIGLETARALAEKNARVIFVGRSPEKGRRVVEEISAETGNEKLHFHLADLSHQSSIRQLAAGIKDQYDRLDVLINNAGAMFWARQLSADGIELTWALNHLNYFLLTSLLLEMLHQNDEARIINVSSDAHLGGDIHFDDVEYQNKFSAFPSYAQSKLANVLFTYELARREEGSGIVVNALTPGFVRSGFGSGGGRLYTLAMRIANIFAKSPQKGARTSVYLASSKAVEGITGKYFANLKCKKSSSLSYDKDTALRLWEISEAMTNLNTT